MYFRGIPPQKESFLQKRTQMSLIQVVRVCVTIMAVLRLFCHVSKISCLLAREAIIQGQMRCNTINYTCTQKLTVSQLNIPYGTKKTKRQRLLQMCVFGRVSASDPAGETYDAPPNPPVKRRGDPSRGLPHSASPIVQKSPKSMRIH